MNPCERIVSCVDGLVLVRSLHAADECLCSSHTLETGCGASVLRALWVREMSCHVADSISNGHVLKHGPRSIACVQVK